MESPRDRVKAVRSALELTQEAFARRVGVGLKAVQHWESGRRTGPDSKSLAKIAQGLGERGGEAALYIAGIASRPEWVTEKVGSGREESDAAVSAEVAEALEVGRAGRRTRTGGRPSR